MRLLQILLLLPLCYRCTYGMDLAASALGVIPCGSGLFEKYNGQSLTGKCVDNVVGMLNEADENNVEFGIDWISRTIKADKDAASLYKECVGLKDGGPAECTPDSTDTKSCCDSNGYGRGIVRDFSIIVGAVIRMIAAKAEDFVMNDFDDEYKVMKERSFKPGGFGVLDEDSSVWSRVTDSCIDHIKEQVSTIIHPLVPEIFSKIVQDVVGNAAQQFVDSLSETVTDVLNDVGRDGGDPILKCFNVEEIVKLLMKPANEAWIDITGEKNELQTKIFTQCSSQKESIVEAARKMESEGREEVEIEQYGINVGMKAVIKMLFQKSADTSNEVLRVIVSHLNQRLGLVTVNAQGLCCIDPAQVMNFGVRAAYARSPQNCCQRNEVECNLHMGCKWYRVEVDETSTEKKMVQCPKVSRVEGVNYIPETENPSFPAKSGCAPLTFLKEDGSPQQVYREPKSEIKCYYQVFMYTFDSREQSGRNCQVDDSDILVFEPKQEPPCDESDSCASLECMRAALKAFKAICPHSDTVCEATPTIRSYPMRDRLEVSCFRDNQMVETQDTELREKTLSEEEKRWVPSFCAKIQGKLGDSCSPWSFFRRDEDVEMCCTALDKARDLTSGKVFRMEQRPGSRTKNVCPYPAECSGCVQTFGQKIRCEPRISLPIGQCDPNYRTTDWCVPPMSSYTLPLDDSSSTVHFRSLRHDNNNPGILEPSLITTTTSIDDDVI